jgi:hypothetical protein
MVLLMGASLASAADQSMGFFVTSKGMGDGANLGGLAGADAHCATLATAAGSKGRTWWAYLSTYHAEKRGILARDRIGKGPWYNANGELIASDLDQLHIMPNLVKRTAVDESGNMIKGRGDKPNEHDILTGSKDDGTAYFPWQKVSTPVPTGPATARVVLRSAIMTVTVAAMSLGTQPTDRLAAAKRS